jgi:hypothetical protein
VTKCSTIASASLPYHINHDQHQSSSICHAFKALSSTSSIVPCILKSSSIMSRYAALTPAASRLVPGAIVPYPFSLSSSRPRWFNSQSLFVFAMPFHVMHLSTFVLES